MVIQLNTYVHLHRLHMASLRLRSLHYSPASPAAWWLEAQCLSCPIALHSLLCEVPASCFGIDHLSMTDMYIHVHICKNRSHSEPCTNIGNQKGQLYVYISTSFTYVRKPTCAKARNFIYKYFAYLLVLLSNVLLVGIVHAHRKCVHIVISYLSVGTFALPHMQR